jgi:hypothetical protein
MSIPQLKSEANLTRSVEPQKTAAVYNHLIDRVDDFTDKLHYQRLANRFERNGAEREAI